MKKLTICALVASTFLTSNAMAASDINPWKECGIGAMIFKDHKMAAAVSNIIWDLGTTAVISKMTDANMCEGKNVQAALFIQDNYNVVLEETSQGAGEHIVAMLNMLEVTPAQQAQVIAAVRSEMATKVSATPSAETYYNVVMANI